MNFICLMFTILLGLFSSTKNQVVHYPQGNFGQKTPVVADQNVESVKVTPLSLPVINLSDSSKKQEDLKKVLPNKTVTPSENKSHIDPTVASNKTTPEKVLDTGQELVEVDENVPELGPGAITRAILVFMLISFAFILYVGLKTCRKKSIDKSQTVVRKYGVRARRSDMEMEPFPLSEDEDDETIFDSRLNLLPGGVTK